MFKKMMILALLLPGVGGCFWGEDRGRYEERHEYHAAVIHPGHVHCVGCGHVFRGGIWIDGD